MDTTAATANFGSRGAKSARDNGAHRKAFLDTYARRRAGLPDVAAPTQITQPVATISQQHVVSPATPVATPAVHQVEAPAPVAQTVPSDLTKVDVTAVEDDFVSVQPAYTPGLYTDVAPASAQEPEQPTQPHAQAVAPVNPERPARTVPSRAPVTNYLDTLTSRHNAAVATATAGVETVAEAPKTEEVELLDERQTQAEERISANLRALYDGDSLTDQLTKNTTSTSAAHVRAIVASAAVCGVMAVGMFTFLTRVESQPVVAQPVGSPVIEVEVNSNPTTAGTPVQAATPGVRAPADPRDPVRMVIGGIGVNAPVEGVGTTADGLMDVPRSYGVVGWYNKGARPGGEAPAVLVGHYTAGSGGVFDKLQDVKDGDLITLTSAQGQNFTYRITKKAKYDKDKVPMAELFKKDSSSRLEIITCAGKWQANNYNKRLVVSAELVR